MCKRVGKAGLFKQMQGGAGGKGKMPTPGMLPPGMSREQVMQMQNALPPEIKAQLRQPGGREKAFATDPVRKHARRSSRSRRRRSRWPRRSRKHDGRHRRRRYARHVSTRKHDARHGRRRHGRHDEHDEKHDARRHPKPSTTLTCYPRSRLIPIFPSAFRTSPLQYRVLHPCSIHVRQSIPCRLVVFFLRSPLPS